MVDVDQPACFPPSLVVAVSSKDDGSMLNRNTDIHEPGIVANRQQFCDKVGTTYDAMVYQTIIYGPGQTYDKLVEVHAAEATRYVEGIEADALFTTEAGVGLFLPVADCVATIVFDPVRKLLALLHLGRHSTLTPLVSATMQYFTERGSNPADIVVWMSPSAKRDTYRLEWFDHADDPDWHEFCTSTDTGYHLDLPGYNQQRFLDFGILPIHCVISSIDTTNDPRYFSHRAGDVADRIAVLAMMR